MLPCTHLVVGPGVDWVQTTPLTEAIMMANISNKLLEVVSQASSLSGDARTFSECENTMTGSVLASTQILAHPVTQVNKDTDYSYEGFVIKLYIVMIMGFVMYPCLIALNSKCVRWLVRYANYTGCFVFWYSVMLFLPVMICHDLTDVLHYHCCSSFGLIVIFLIVCCKYDFKMRLFKQAGYLPRNFDEREEYKEAVRRTKWYKKKLQFYEQALTFVRMNVVPPSTSERCYADGHILCVFRLGNRHYLLKFRQTGLCQSLDDAFASLANEIYMSKHGRIINHQSEGLLSTLRLTEDDNYEDVLYSIYLCIRFWQTKQMDYLYALFRLFRKHSRFIKTMYDSGLKRVLGIIKKAFFEHSHHFVDGRDGDIIASMFDESDPFAIDLEEYQPINERPSVQGVSGVTNATDDSKNIHVVTQSGVGLSSILGTIHNAKNVLSDRGFVSLITIVTGTLVLLTGHKFARRDDMLYSSFNNLLHNFTDHVMRISDIVETPRSILTLAENALECVHMLYKRYVKGEYVLSYDEVTKFHQDIVYLRGTVISNLDSGFDMVDYTNSGPLFDLSWRYEYRGVPTSYNEMVDIITKTYATGKKLIRTFHTGHATSSMAHVRKSVEDDFVIIERLYNKMTKDLSNQTERVAPFSALIFGASGIGKSRIMQHLIDVVCGVAKVPNKSHYIFTVQEGQKYWNGFTSCVHTIIFDDLGAAKQTTFDPSAPIPTLLRVVNDVAFVPDQAAVEDKGQHYCQPLHVIASSNYKQCNVHEFMHHRGATLRRMPIVITPEVKTEYRLPGGALDTSKTNDSADDYHTFIVEKCYATHVEGEAHGGVRYEKVHFVDSSGICRVNQGQCNSLLDLKVFYAEAANSYYSSLWDHKRKFKTACEEHGLLIPCYKCALNRNSERSIDEIQVVQHEMGRIPPPQNVSTDEEGNSGTNSNSVIQRAFQCGSKLYRLRTFTGNLLSWLFYLVATASVFVFWEVADRIISLMEFNQRQSVMIRSHINDALQGYGFIHYCLMTLLDLNDKICDIIIYAFIMCRPARYLGRVFNHIQRNRLAYYALATTAFVSLLYGVIKGLKLFNAVASQTLTNSSGVPAPVNPWNQDVKDIFVGEGSRCAAGKSREDAIRGLLKRCVTITSVSDSDKDTIVARGVFLSSNIIMTVAHFVDAVVPDKDNNITIAVILDTINGDQKYKCTSTNVVSGRVIRKPGVRSDDKDIVYLQINSTFNFTDITGASRGDYFFDDDGEVDELYSYLVSGKTPLKIVGNKRLRTTGVFDLYNYESPIETRTGDSGSLLIGITKRGLPVIVGLHIGIGTTMFTTKPVFAYVCKRNLTDFNQAIRPISMAIHQSMIVNSEEVSSRSLASGVCPYVKCDTEERTLYFANVSFIGEVKGARQAITPSNFTISDEAEFVKPFAEKHGVELIKEPPDRSYVLTIAKERNYDSNQVAAVNKTWPSINWWYYNMSLIRPLATQSRLNHCCDIFFKRIISNLGEEKLDKMSKYIRVLTLNEAINGVAQDPNVGGLNMKTSTGFPFFTRKINAMVYVDPNSSERTLSTEPMKVQCGGENISPLDDYLETLQSYKEFSRSGKPFVSRYKDEPIKLEKLFARGRRLFMNGPMSTTICIRQYFLMLVTFIKVYALDFHCVYGINASSMAWKSVYTRLSKFQYWNDGDFLAFDVNISTQLLTAISDRIFIPLLRRSPNFDSVPTEMLKVMLYECTNALVLVDNDLMLLNGMNPSGNPLTTIFNCFANVIYHMIAYEDILGSDKIEGFFDHVEFLSYGDDSVYTTNNKMYNCESISKALGMYGITYTNSKKQSGLEFTPKEDIVLVQRSFVQDGDIVLAPLNKSSILRAIHITDLSAESQFIRWQGVVCSLWFESFHYICGFGEELRDYLRGLAQRKGVAVPDTNRDMWLKQYRDDSLPWMKFHFGDEIVD